MRKVYLAARFSRREELIKYAFDLHDRGFAVTSRWLVDPSHCASVAPEMDDLGRNSQEFNNRLAEEDLEDIGDSDTLIYFSPGSARGGCHVEFGYALAMGLKIVVVGERDHVFSFMSKVECYPDWPSALRGFGKIERKG